MKQVQCPKDEDDRGRARVRDIAIERLCDCWIVIEEVFWTRKESNRETHRERKRVKEKRTVIAIQEDRKDNKHEYL